MCWTSSFGRRLKGRPCTRACTRTLLDRADGPFDLADVTVGGDDIECDRFNVLAYAFELLVCVNVADIKAADFILFENNTGFAQDREV